VTDIRTISTAGPIGLAFDWSMFGGALGTDGGMETAIIQSLFTDATSAADDDLPDNSGDRRGCWMDTPLEGVKTDKMGSRLWLLERAKATVKTATRARRYALEALQWFIDDGIADQVEVTAEYVTREQLKLTVNIIRQVNAQPVNHRYDFVWNPAQPTAFVQHPVPLLGTEDGGVLVTEDGQEISLF
jgi:phage gp46-like protein